jgi:hypothetical protein
LAQLPALVTRKSAPIERCSLWRLPSLRSYGMSHYELHDPFTFTYDPDPEPLYHILPDPSLCLHSSMDNTHSLVSPSTNHPLHPWIPWIPFFVAYSLRSFDYPRVVSCSFFWSITLIHTHPYMCYGYPRSLVDDRGTVALQHRLYR